MSEIWNSRSSSHPIFDMRAAQKAIAADTGLTRTVWTMSQDQFDDYRRELRYMRIYAFFRRLMSP